MMNWLHYLVEANIYLGIFYLCYFLFFKKETYYTLNRAYLLLSCVIAFVLPLIKVSILKPANYAIKSIVLIRPFNFNRLRLPIKIASTENHLSLRDAVFYIYLLVAGILLVLLIIKLFRLFILTRSQSSTNHNQYKLIYINDSNTAFSFLNYLFIGTKIPCADTIVRHELVHIRQRHSFDIILLEILKIINWFNPMIYLLQNSFKTLHEYIADEETVAFEINAFTYSDFLINNAYGISGSSVTHSFFNYNLLKRRIIMLHQKRSGSLARLKYLIALPVCAGMLCASTLGFSKTYGWIDLAPMKTRDTTKNVHKTSPKKITHIDTFTTVKYHHKLPKIKITDVILMPPPAPPMQRIRFPKPKPLGVTKTGYKYVEAGYLVNNETNYSVIIIEKNGAEKEYFKNSATREELSLLKNKYGYTFPTMKIYPQLPPPPPMPPTAPKPLDKGLSTIPPTKLTNLTKYPPLIVINSTLPVKVSNIQLTLKPLDTVQRESIKKR